MVKACLASSYYSHFISATGVLGFLFVILILVLSLARLFYCYFFKQEGVYLLDFSCLTAPPYLRCPSAHFAEQISLINHFDGKSIDFMIKVLKTSGIGEETCLPPSLHCLPPNVHLQESLKEARMLLFRVLDDLFAKNQVNPTDIDILVVNCSGFCPFPSLSSIVVNHYNMREDIKTFNISGMGCSASIIGVDIVKDLLKLRPNSHAILLSTEILSTVWYGGRDPPKLVLNCSFRMGSAAILLTNRKDCRQRARYKLVHLLRTQSASNDGAYNSVIRKEDSQGITGCHIERNILYHVREIIRDHIIVFGSMILPLKEKLRYVFYHFINTMYSDSSLKMKKDKYTYIPRFGSVIQHYCIPASGLPIIREIGKGMALTEWDMEPAIAIYRRFGNQGSASMWYQMEYMAVKRRLAKGDKIWLFGFGTGLKCCSAVWECLVN